MGLLNRILGTARRSTAAGGRSRPAAGGRSAGGTGRGGLLSGLLRGARGGGGRRGL